MNEKIGEAAETLAINYNAFGKNLVLQQPFYYDSSMMLACDGNHDPDLYAAYWYHPDHLGSSSYITNLKGEINQHLEYLPFGETLVEEHLNSHNSPFKFNAKELDTETGNYYYSARYYTPKYNLMLSVDPMYDLYPSFSPYAYTLQNPVRFVDPTGMVVESPDHDYGYDKKTGALKMIKKTDDEFDRIYSGEFSSENEFKKDDLLLTLNKGTLVEEFDRDFSKEGLIFGDLSEGLQAMKALSFTAEIEFSAWAFEDVMENEGLIINPWIGNTHSKSIDYLSRTGPRVGNFGLLGKKLFHIHTHPSNMGGFGYPSDPDKNHLKHNPNLPHYILSRNHGITKYNQNSVYTVKDLN